MEYAWSNGGEVKFMYKAMLFTYGVDGKLERPQEATSPKSALRRFFTESGRSVNIGIIFVPPESKVDDEATVAMLGICDFVPENIDYVIVTDVARVGKMDLKRKLLAYNPNHIVLADFIDHDERALYTQEDFELVHHMRKNDYDRWFVHRIPDKDKQCEITAGMRSADELVQMFSFLEKATGVAMMDEEQLIQKCMSLVEAMEDPPSGQKAVAKAAMKAFADLRYARKCISALSFGHVQEIMPYEKCTAQHIADMLCDVMNFLNMGTLMKRTIWTGHQTPLKRDPFLCWDMEGCDPDSSKNLSEAYRTIAEMHDIWDKVLRRNNSIFHLPVRMMNPYGNEEQQSLNLEAIRQLGILYGIDSHVDAYFAGVPIDDIFA